MIRWRERLRDVRRAIVWALGRFPVSVVALGLFAVLVNLQIAELLATDEDTMLRAGVALVGAAALAGAAVLFGESKGIAAVPRQLLSLLLGLAVGAALWFSARLAIAYPALFTATLLAVPLAPYVRRAPGGFWDFVWHLIHAAALALIAIVVFCAGLSAILASIEYLFGIAVRSSIYGHVWSIGLGFVGPLFALSLVPRAFPEADHPQGTDVLVAGIRLLSDFVAVPLLAAYVVILHLYALKIAVEGELPKGQIGWMVLSFGMAVLALRVVVHPMAALSRLSTRLFLRYWAVGLIVPLVLLVIAVRERVGAYGWTPERYSLALFAAFLAAVLAAQLLPRLRGDIRLIPALGALALFLGSFGPWGMFEASAASQMQRLMAKLAAAEALEGGVVMASPRFSQGDARDIRSIVDVLSETQQIDRLRPLFAGRSDDPFAERATARNDWAWRQRLWEALNVKELPPVSEEGVFAIASRPGATAIDGFDIVIARLVLPGSRDVTTAVDGMPLTLHLDTGRIAIADAGRTVAITPDMLRDAVAARLAAVETVLPEEQRPPFVVVLEPGGARVGLVFDTLAGRLAGGVLTLNGGSFDLYLRRSDWQAPASGSEPPRLPEP